MKSKENIVLGMMGSGKSSIGRLFSKKLKLNFYDIDELIENVEGMKISKIFNKKGENYFREIEQNVTIDILKKKNIVVALGGGSFLNKNIREEIQKKHLSFWLNWNSEILINRIQNSHKRPIAFKASKNELINIIEKRSKIYSKAMYKINCNNLTKNQIINKVLDIYEKHKTNN